MNDKVKGRGKHGKGLSQENTGNSLRGFRKPPVRWAGKTALTEKRK